MNYHFFYRYTKSQRKGLLALCLLIIFVQVGYWLVTLVDYNSTEKQSGEEKEWLALQSKIDALKAARPEKKNTIYLFNPNFITDYKGYTLGMTTAQIDKLHAFRKSGKWINSVSDFKTVTGVPDSLLSKISPYFKFPDWVIKKNKESAQGYANNETKFQNKYPDKYPAKKEAAAKIVLDINTAVEEDLIGIYGIGPAFAKKILRRRSDLGAFVSMEQVDDFSDFSPEARSGLKKSFKISGNPVVNKINVNTASLQQLSRFPYFNRDIAKAIITERSMKGKITNFADLIKINDIFTLKSKIIALYLEY
jgi:DNA uptake protein ComE-like DNA-binding protein